MQKLFRKKQSPLVGVDIRSSAIQLLEFSDEAPAFLRFGAFELLSDGIVINGEVCDLRRFAHAIQKLRLKGAITDRAVVALSGPVVLRKELSLERGRSESEIERIVLLEAEKWTRDLGQECYLDFCCDHATAIDSDRQKIAVFTSPKNHLNRLWEALLKSKITTEIMDVDYYALVRALALSSMPRVPTELPLVQAIFNSDSDRSIFVVIKAEAIIYSRSEFKRNSRSLTEAKRLLGTEDWLSGYADKAHRNDSVRSNLLKILGPSVLQELNQCLKLYYSSGFCPLNQIILSGECAIVPELGNYIQEKLQQPVVVANPFVNITFGEKVDKDRLMAVGPAFMLCSGLALGNRSYDFH
jgi:type IV pilus assembly protein PilM